MQGLENSYLSLINRKDVNALKLKIIEKEKELNRKKTKAELEKGYREKLKEIITTLSKTSEDAAKSL